MTGVSQYVVQRLCKSLLPNLDLFVESQLILISNSTKKACVRAVSIDELETATIAIIVVRQHIGRKTNV